MLSVPGIWICSKYVTVFLGLHSEIVDIIWSFQERLMCSVKYEVCCVGFLMTCGMNTWEKDWSLFSALISLVVYGGSKHRITLCIWQCACSCTWAHLPQSHTHTHTWTFQILWMTCSDQGYIKPISLTKWHTQNCIIAHILMWKNVQC